MVDIAVGAGADEAEAMALSAQEVNVELQKNDLNIAKSMSGNSLGIRVYRDRSLGFAYVNSFEEENIRDSVERAMGIAAGAPSDENNALPDPTPVASIEGLYDPQADDFGVEKAVELALSMLRAARDYDPRVTIDSGELSGHTGEKAIASTRGVEVSERSSFFYSVIMGMAREGDSVSSFDYQFEGAWSPSRMDPVAMALKLAKNVVDSLGAVSGETFKGPVILAPKAASGIVVSPVMSSASASSVQRETSRFRGRLGEVVGSELLTVIDESRLPEGAGSTSFDREGIAPESLHVIEKGVLRSFLYDSYTARKDGRSSNGHAGGGVSAVPVVSSTNVVLSPGETPLADMIAGIDKGVLVTRFAGNVDPVSGDFSGSVKGGRMIRGGRLEEPLSGTMIAGNTFDSLSRVTAVSKETERMFSTVVPYLAVDGLSVTSE